MNKKILIFFLTAIFFISVISADIQIFGGEQNNKVINLEHQDIVNSSSSSGNITNFTQLHDTPDSYSGQSQKCIRVNSAENALEFFDCPSGSSLTNVAFLNNTQTFTGGQTINNNSGASAALLVRNSSGVSFLNIRTSGSLAGVYSYTLNPNIAGSYDIGTQTTSEWRNAFFSQNVSGRYFFGNGTFLSNVCHSDGTNCSTITSAAANATYLKRDGTTALTGNWDAGSFRITSNALTVGDDVDNMVIFEDDSGNDYFRVDTFTSTRQGVHTRTLRNLTSSSDILGYRNLNITGIFQLIGNIFANSTFFRISQEAKFENKVNLTGKTYVNDTFTTFGDHNGRTWQTELYFQQGASDRYGTYGQSTCTATFGAPAPCNGTITWATYDIITSTHVATGTYVVDYRQNGIGVIGGSQFNFTKTVIANSVDSFAVSFPRAQGAGVNKGDILCGYITQNGTYNTAGYMAIGGYCNVDF